MNEPIKFSVSVHVSAEEAFNTFTSCFQSWWPAAYTLSQDVLVKIGIEPKEGGLCFEIGPHDFRCDWGRVIKWNPPSQLILSWQVNQNSAPEPNPAKASELHVNFVEVNGATKVEIEHHNIHRHSSGNDKYREELESEYGWPYLLSEFQKYQNGL